MPRYVMLIEAAKCLNCKACILACQQRNAVPYGPARNWVREIPDEAQGLAFQPGGCMHCDNPPCVAACPTAATYKAPDGRVMADDSRCIGCGACVRNCPYKARFIHPARRVVDKCDYCAASLADGFEPACVGVCATRTRTFGDADDPASPVSRLLAAAGPGGLASVEPEGSDIRPTLRYLGPVKDRHWPAVAADAGPVALMPPVAAAVRWLGGLGLLGVGALLVRDRLTARKAAHPEAAPETSAASSAEAGFIRRHSGFAVAMHWFNAVCWLLLLATGFALLQNPAMQPVGEWWPRLWNSLLGARGVLVAHLALGAVWIIGSALYVFGRWKAESVPFLKEVFALRPLADAVWCLRKGGVMLLGERGMRRLGLNPELEPQGFYNAGQKLVAVVAVLGSVGLALTGLWLTALALHLVDPAPYAGAAQWGLFLHLVCAGAVAVFLPVHVYMAACAPGEEPALRSMFTGLVPEDFVRHHNPLWYAELSREGRAGRAGTDPHNLKP